MQPGTRREVVEQAGKTPLMCQTPDASTCTHQYGGKSNSCSSDSRGQKRRREGGNHSGACVSKRLEEMNDIMV